VVTIVTHAQANIRYSRLFGAYVDIAMKQSTFEGMRDMLVNLYAQTNETFKDFDTWTTYSTPVPWDQNYAYSLRAQQDYYKQLWARLDSTIQEKEQILSGNKTILVPYNQWYQETLDSLRDEIQPSPSLNKLSWILKGAWYLNFAPLAYWGAWGILGVVILIVVILWVFD